MRANTWATLVGAAALALMAPGCASPPEPPVTAAAPNAFADVFAQQAQWCAAREDNSHPVFRGCVDWHSAAHAHYALEAFTVLTGDQQYRAWLDGSLDAARLEAERSDLAAQPDFEMPYGRAWFLRLYVARKAAGGDDRLAPLAQDIVRSMHARYSAQAPDPNARDYRSATFAMINLLAYARATGDVATEAVIARETRARWMAPEARCDLAAERPGFLSTCLIWAWLVAEVATKEEFATWFATWNPGIETLAPLDLKPGANAHLFGKNFSRAWGYAALYRKTGEPRWRDLYCAHFDFGYANWTATKDDYMAVGHWVAQFGMLAVEEGKKAGIRCG